MILIAILGGNLKKNKRGWRTTNFDEEENFTGFGDRLRVVAGWYLYNKVNKDRSDVFIMASGGKGKLRSIKGAPAEAKILKKELAELGVPPESIVEESNSGNTFEQLVALNKIICDEKISSIVLVSNKYHLPRIKAMVEYYPELRMARRLMRSGKLRLTSAETVCLRHDPKKWRNVIRRGYALSHIKKIIRLEKQGVIDLKKGRYKL